MANRFLNSALQLLAMAVAVPHCYAVTMEYRLSCPALLDARTIRLDPGSQGWKPFVPSSLLVQTGRIIIGSPETLSFTKPSFSTDGRYQNAATWRIRNVPGLEKWLTCGYGAAGELSLSKALPPDVFVCTVTTSKDIGSKVTSVTAQCLRDVKLPSSEAG